jgi:hypothetical protein
MLTALSRYDNVLTNQYLDIDDEMDMAMRKTFSSIIYPKNYKFASAEGITLIQIKNISRFLMNNDGTGSKSIVCRKVGMYTDIYDTLAMCGDDAAREVGAKPLFASVGIHAEDSEGKEDIIRNMVEAGCRYQIPMVGCVFHESPDVYTYIMNGSVLSEVTDFNVRAGKPKVKGVQLVILPEEQRSNGVTTQRNILTETFGKGWYDIESREAYEMLNDRLEGKYSKAWQPGYWERDKRKLGKLVAKHSTPYFRADSMMPKKLLRKKLFSINISSGGVIGKSRRKLEPYGIGAEFYNLFEAPKLTFLIQMSSRLKESKGVVTDEVVYFTWGNGQGEIVATRDPMSFIQYYESKGLNARIGGILTTKPEISIVSRCLDSTLVKGPYVITHKYTQKQLG